MVREKECLGNGKLYIHTDPSRRDCHERIIKKWTIRGGELISECLPTNILQKFHKVQ